MNVLDRKLLRELTRSWALVLAVISIMAVGVTCFVGLQSVHRNLTGARRNYYDQCRMADFWIDVKKVPVVELDAVAKLPGIREIRPRIQYAVTVDLEEVRQPINGLVLSLPTKRASVVNDIILRQGDYFSDKRRNEVIVNDAFARRHRLYPGSRLHLLLNNRREELFIVGTAISCEFTYLIGPGTFVPDPEHFGVFYVKQEFAEEVFDLEGAANQIVGRFAPGEKMGKESLRQAETLLDSYGVLQVTPLKLQSSNQFLTGEIDQIGTFATIFPTIFLIVAALVLNVLMLRLARQQRTVIGTLKAIGYSDRQVFLHFLKFGLIVGLIAGLLGGVGGYFDSLLMTTMYSWFFQFPNLRNEFSGQAYAIGIGLALSCSWIGSWYGSRAALALPPAQAMRPEPPRQGRAILLERATWLWGRLNASWRMTARNLFRNRLRTGMGIFSATMGASLMINGFMLVEATRFMIDFHFFRLSTSDIDLAFDEEQGIEAIDELKHLPGVDLAEPALAVSCNLKHGPYQRKTVLTGLLPQPQLTTPRDTAGEKLRVPDDGVLLTQRLADLLHARRGDRITMVPVKGGRRPIELQVVEIGDSYIGISAYANIHTLSRAVEEELVVTGAQLKTDGDRMHLDSLYREFKRMPGIQAVNSRHDLITNLVQTLITNQRVMISVIVTFAGIVFLGSITNASLISLGERLSEVATLRAIGYGPWQVGNLFLRESLITTLLGVCFGLPGGYWLTWLMTASYENEMLKIPLVSAAWVWQAAFLLAVVFTLAAHCIVQISIHWMNVPDTLKAKE